MCLCLCVVIISISLLCICVFTGVCGLVGCFLVGCFKFGFTIARFYGDFRFEVVCLKVYLLL